MEPFSLKVGKVCCLLLLRAQYIWLRPQACPRRHWEQWEVLKLLLALALATIMMMTLS